MKYVIYIVGVRVLIHSKQTAIYAILVSSDDLYRQKKEQKVIPLPGQHSSCGKLQSAIDTVQYNLCWGVGGGIHRWLSSVCCFAGLGSSGTHRLFEAQINRRHVIHGVWIVYRHAEYKSAVRKFSCSL